MTENEDRKGQAPRNSKGFDEQFKRASALVIAKKWSEAEAILEKLRSGASDPMVYQMLAEVYRQTNRLEEARDLLEKLISSDPSLIEPRILLSQVQGRLGNNQAAIDQLLAVVKSQPNHVRAHALLGDLFILEKDPHQACFHLNEAHRREPSNPAFLARLAYAMNCLEMYDEAITEVQKSPASAAQALEVRLVVVQSLIGQKEFQKAANELHQLAVSSSHPTIFQLQARVAIAQNDKETAYWKYQQACLESPDDFGLQDEFGRFLIQQGEWATAGDVYWELKPRFTRKREATIIADRLNAISTQLKKKP